jgi:transcriptional regulator with XRE-family HTH domain
MTQQGLAVAAGMTRPHISLIEAGKINVTIKKIEAICRALGIHPDQLFETVKLDL